MVLDGVNDLLRIPNSSDINSGGPFPERTIHIELTPNDVTSRQVVYKEGGGIRGLNIYIENSLLYFGGYNIPETGYQPTFVSAPITAGIPISASITLNGNLVDRTPNSQLYSHGGGIGVGAANGITVFHDGAGSGGTLSGSIDSLSIYNRALSDLEIGGL